MRACVSGMNPVYKALLVSYLDLAASGRAGLAECRSAARHGIRAAIDALAIGEAELRGIMRSPLPGRLA